MADKSHKIIWLQMEINALNEKRTALVKRLQAIDIKLMDKAVRMSKLKQT